MSTSSSIMRITSFLFVSSMPLCVYGWLSKERHVECLLLGVFLKLLGIIDSPIVTPEILNVTGTKFKVFKLRKPFP